MFTECFVSFNVLVYIVNVYERNKTYYADQKYFVLNFFSTNNIIELKFLIINFRKCCAKVQLMTPVSESPTFVSYRLLCSVVPWD